MTSTVDCPECHRPATVIGRFSLAGTGGPVEYLRIRCAGPLSLLVPAADVRPDSRRPRSAAAA